MKRVVMISGVASAMTIAVGTVHAASQVSLGSAVVLAGSPSPVAKTGDGPEAEGDADGRVSEPKKGDAEAESDERSATKGSPGSDADADPKSNECRDPDTCLEFAESKIDKGELDEADAALLRAKDMLSDTPNAKFDELVNRLRFAHGTVQERALEQSDGGGIAKTHGCASTRTLCVRGDGSGFHGDGTPVWLDAAHSFDVRVIGCKGTYADATFDVKADSKARSERLFRERYDGPHDTSRTGKRDLVRSDSFLDFCTSASDMTVLHETTVDVTDDPTKDGLRITVTRQATEDGAVPVASNTHSSRIEHGRYFLDFGLMVPVVFAGEQTVEAVPLQQTPTDFALTERSDLLVVPAIALNVFPAGRERGKIGSFTGYTCPKTIEKRDSHGKAKKGRHDETKMRAETSCRRHRDRRRTANSLGFQVAVDVDLRNFDRMFFGPMFEPVAGLTIGAGVAAVKGKRLTEGTSVGRIVDRDEIDTYTRNRFVARPYVSVTFSLDIIRNLAGFRGRAP